MPSTPSLCPPRALAAAALLACAIAAHAQAPRSYDLPAQPLGSTLARIAADSGQQISIDAALVRGRTAPAVQGHYTAEQAARAALAGSGLELVRTDNGNWALRRAAATAAMAGTASAQAAAPAALPTVTVTGAAIHETAYGPVGGFVATRSATATKTDTRLFETAQSVSVVPREQIQAQAADSLDQALEYTAGVSKFEGGGTRSAGTRISVRGFNTTGTEALYLDGSKFPANSLSGSLEPYHFERIELLKGPASIMYGQGTPGGIINLVSKRPTAAPLREVEVQAGSWSRKQVAVDLGGPVTEDGRIRYRLTGLQRDSESMIRQNPNDRTSLSAALDWQLTDATLLTLLGAYDTAHAAFDPGKPLDGTLLPNPAGRISRHLFVGEPGTNRHDSQGTRLGYQLEHAFNDAWKFRQNLLAYDYDIDSDYVAVYPRVAAATPRLAQRYAVLRTDGDKGASLDNQLHGKVRHGRFEHTLLFGLDWRQSHFERTQRFGTVSPLDLFSPAYGAPISGTARSGEDRSRQLGLYAQDQIKFDERWIAVIGGRYDATRYDEGAGTPADKAHAFTPRLGLMYLAGNGIAPYYSYSRSFQPTAGTDFHLNRLQPTTGTQHEIGVKYEPQGMDASVTVAAYEIKQRNVLTSDPDHVGYLVQTGEVRSRGVEVEGRAEIGRHWSLVAALAVTDAKITASNAGDVGARPASVPRTTASLWVDYQLPAAPGLSLGLGVRRVGEQEVSRMAVPSFTVYDAAVRYQWDRWQFALNLKNLADKTYVAACSSVCYYGDERNFTLTARYRW